MKVIVLAVLASCSLEYNQSPEETPVGCSTQSLVTKWRAANLIGTIVCQTQYPGCVADTAKSLCPELDKGDCAEPVGALTVFDRCLAESAPADIHPDCQLIFYPSL